MSQKRLVRRNFRADAARSVWTQWLDIQINCCVALSLGRRDYGRMLVAADVASASNIARIRKTSKSTERSADGLLRM